MSFIELQYLCSMFTREKKKFWVSLEDHVVYFAFYPWQSSLHVSRCKNMEVPVDKIYNKSQRDKFAWAIDMTEADFAF